MTNGTKISDTNLQQNDLVMILIVKSNKEKEDKRMQEETEHEDVINELIEEGFEREEVLEALRHTGFNRDLALDYLENGLEEENPNNNLILNMDANQIDNMDDIALNNAIDDAIDHFLSDPSFTNLREQIRNDPSSANQLVEQVRTMNPAFHQILVDNPEIVDEIVDSVQQFGEDELGEPLGEDEGDWEDVDGNNEPLNNNRKLLFVNPILRIE